MNEVKLTMEAKGETTQLECKSCIFLAFDPCDTEADMVQGMLGMGDPRLMLIKAAESLYQLVERSLKDETEKIIVGALMVDHLKKAMVGETNMEVIQDAKEV